MAWRSDTRRRIPDGEANDPGARWASCERMRRDDDLYELGMIVAHNAERVPGAAVDDAQPRRRANTIVAVIRVAPADPLPFLAGHLAEQAGAPLAWEQEKSELLATIESLRRHKHELELSAATREAGVAAQAWAPFQVLSAAVRWATPALVSSGGAGDKMTTEPKYFLFGEARADGSAHSSNLGCAPCPRVAVRSAHR